MTETKLSRRSLMQGAATFGAASLAGGLPAFAQENKKIIVGTWGGDYARLLNKNIEQPHLIPKGFEIAQDHASDQPRRAKMIAEKRLPRGTSDVQGLSDINIAQMTAADTIEELDFSKMPNAANILPVLRNKRSVPHIYSGLVLVYNPKMINPAPTSISDLWNPQYAGKAGVIDIQYIYTIMAASLAGGGSMTNFKPGMEKLLEGKKNGLKIYPTNEALAQALKTEEIGLCIMWKARGVQWQNAGIPVETAAPKEGVVLYVSTLAMPKNAPNKAGAYAYLNASMEPSAQIAFAHDMGFNPTVSNAPLPDDLRKRIGFTDEEQKRMVNPDFDYITKIDPEIKEWWDKVFKA